MPVADIEILREAAAELVLMARASSGRIFELAAAVKTIADCVQPITDHDANNASAVNQTAAALSPEDANVDLAPLTASNARLELSSAQPHRFSGTA